MGSSLISASLSSVRKPARWEEVVARDAVRNRVAVACKNALAVAVDGKMLGTRRERDAEMLDADPEWMNALMRPGGHAQFRRRGHHHGDIEDILHVAVQRLHRTVFRRDGVFWMNPVEPEQGVFQRRLSPARIGKEDSS